MASGRETISQRIALEGGKEIQDQLKGIGEAGERAFKQIKSAGDQVSGVGGQIGKGINEAQQAMKQAAEAGAKLGDSLRDVGGAFTRVGASVAAAGAAFGAIGLALGKMAMGGAEAADAVGKSAMSLGLSIQEFGRLQFAAEQSGVAADQFGATISRLNAQIEKTNDAAEPAGSALGRLGVAVKASNGGLRPTTDILGDIADKFASMPDGAQKSAAAIEIFGRAAGPRLIPLLNEGRKGIKALGDEAEKSGLIFSELEVKLGTDMNDAISQMARTARAARDKIGLMFAPVIKEAADAMTQFLRDNNAAIQEWGQSVVGVIAPVIRDLVRLLSGQGDEKIDTTWLLTIRDAVTGIATVVQSAFQGLILPTLREVIGVLNVVAGAFNLIFGTTISGGALALALVIGKLSGAFALMAAAVRASAAALALLQLAALAGTLGTVTAALTTFMASLRGVALAIGVFVGSSTLLSAGFVGLQAGLVAFGAALLSTPFLIAAVGVAAGALIVTLFGLDWGGIATRATAAWTLIVDAFRLMNATLVANGGMTVGSLQALWQQYVGNFRANLERIREIGVWAWLGEQIAKVGAMFGELGAKIVEGFTSWIDGVQSRFNSFFDLLSGMIDNLIAKFRALFSAKGAAGSAGGGGNSQGGFPVPAFSGGGRVWGAGTATSDSIPARLSAGEFVIREKAVRHYGPRLFDLLNRLALARDSLRGFAGGGPVEALRASMTSIGSSGFRIATAGLGGASADGGAVSARRSFDLVIDGQRFSGLSAANDTAAELQKLAMRKRVSSAGRAPNWQGVR